MTATLAAAARTATGGYVDIPHFEGLYTINRSGSVRSVDRYVPQGSRWGHPVAKFHHGRELAAYVTKSGRRQVILHAEGRRYCPNIDDLVTQVFGEEAAS
jgi:hypothetical protein